MDFDETWTVDQECTEDVHRCAIDVVPCVLLSDQWFRRRSKERAKRATRQQSIGSQLRVNFLIIVIVYFQCVILGRHEAQMNGPKC